MRKLGEKTAERVEALGKTVTGTVVYVHPRRRYYTVEFRFLYGSFRESFSGPGGAI